MFFDFTPFSFRLARRALMIHAARRFLSRSRREKRTARQR